MLIHLNLGVGPDYHFHHLGNGSVSVMIYDDSDSKRLSFAIYCEGSKYTAFAISRSWCGMQFGLFGCFTDTVLQNGKPRLWQTEKQLMNLNQLQE